MKTQIIGFLCLLLSTYAYSDEDNKPLNAMSTCLIMHQWSAWGIWRFDIYALASDKILIGNKNNHFLITADEPGYKHVISGDIVASYPDATSLKELGKSCHENCPVNYKKRTGWFKRRCRSYEA